MAKYRFQLDSTTPRKKYTCPSCGKRNVFVKFIDTISNDFLPDQYGKCERADHCAYFLSPYKDGYSKDIWEAENQNNNYVSGTAFSTLTTHKRILKPNTAPPVSSDIPLNVLKDTLNDWSGNEFVNGLVRLAGKKVAVEYLSRYYVGSSNRSWSGATTLPFIDINQKTRAIQVKKFDLDMHTAKYTSQSGDRRSCTTWLHSELEQVSRQNNHEVPSWLTGYKQNETKVSCFFGEHLLSLKGNEFRPVAIVEAPKTAIIASVYYDQLLKHKNYIWLAAGALGYLTPEKCEVLRGRTVTLFPDLNAFDRWSEKARAISSITRVSVSDLLERKASPKDRERGFDLADYLMKIPLQRGSGENKVPEPEFRTDDIECILTETHTGKDYDEAVIAYMRTKKGNIDVLFNSAGEFFSPEQSPEIFANLSRFYNKAFVPVKFDQVVAWIQHSNSN